MHPRRALPATLFALATLPAIAACAGVTPKTPNPGRDAPAVRYAPVAFDALAGWPDADPRRALSAFRRGCGASGAWPAPNGAPGATDTAAWRPACTAALRVADDPAAARAFFERHFVPHAVSGPDGATGLFTGYYEPELRAARTRRPGYDVPIHGLPPGAVSTPVPPLAARAAIEAGDPAAYPVLYWAADPVDVFTLHIQGSGRLVLAEGGFARIAYAGNNGHAYVAIGRLMRERGLLAAGDTTMPAIRAWLRANPEAGRALMRENPRYIFFRRVGDGEGPAGRMGVTLTPLASLAVDPAAVPANAPLWLDTNWPREPARPLRLLVVAQDVGAAIKGAVRGDIFWGSGDAALDRAGRMAERGRYFVFLPRR